MPDMFVDALTWMWSTRIVLPVRWSTYLVKDMVHSRVGRIVLLAFAAVLFTVVFVEDNDPIIRILRSVVMSTSLGVVISYALAMEASIREKGFSPETLLPAGIWLTWLGEFINSTYWLTWKVRGEPPGWSDRDTVIVFLALKTVGGVFHMIAHEAIDGHVPAKYWIKIGTWIGSFVLVIVLVTLYLAGESPPAQYITVPGVAESSLRAPVIDGIPQLPHRR